MNQITAESTNDRHGRIKRFLITFGEKTFAALVEMGQNTSDSHLYMNYTAGPMDMPLIGESLVRSKKL